jgi:UDP-N-acetylglucosamine--N-acetylmuramyl-(pentapeptide) pyrophosphoryl-undecaprenol N-acetylglucosamine transferase
MVSIAFTGGGTGGHIYPGLAVAAELKKLLSDREFQLFWIGSSARLDRSLVEEAGIKFFSIPSGKLRRYFSLRTIVDFFKIIGGYFAARKILKKQNTGLLFSKGGFVSVPPCAAASSLGIKVFTHESDFSPGLATKINASFAARTNGRIFTAYEETGRFLHNSFHDHITVSGNPVRSVFHNADAEKGRAFLGVDEAARILLVLGGSQGAVEINELIRAVLPELTQIYTVVHQTGPNLTWDVPAGKKYKPFPYIKNEMPHVMAAAELVMGRSGAGIWEWAVLGKPMLLIPLRGYGTRGDQVENANYFQNAKAAQVLGVNITPWAVIGAVTSIAQDEEKRKNMSAASAKIGEKDGAVIIARVLAEELERHFEGGRR